MVEILILVAVYNIDPIQSSTIRSLLKCDMTLFKVRVVLWDNSPIRHEICVVRELLQKKGLQCDFIHTPENLSLSKMYNRVFAEWSEKYRSEERSVGKECVSKCRFGWWHDNKKKK